MKFVIYPSNDIHFVTYTVCSTRTNEINLRGNNKKTTREARYFITHFNNFEQVIDAESNAQQRPVVSRRNVKKWFE